jgi:hypothetical protein
VGDLVRGDLPVRFGGGHGVLLQQSRRSGAREARTRNLEIPGSVLRTAPE